METISNETKAKEICHCSECTYKIKSEGDNCMCPRMAAILQAMEWKDEQIAFVLSFLKTRLSANEYAIVCDRLNFSE